MSDSSRRHAHVPRSRGKTTPASTAGSFATHAHSAPDVEILDPLSGSFPGGSDDPFGDDSWWNQAPSTPTPLPDPAAQPAEAVAPLPPTPPPTVEDRTGDHRLGTPSGLTHPGGPLAGQPIVVTEHNRDLLADLTQADLDDHTPALVAAIEEETRRLRSAISPGDITLPANPTVDDIRRAAAHVDAAFADISPTLGPHTVIPGPQPVLAQVYGTPDRALVAIGQAVATHADQHAAGAARGGALAVEERWLGRVGSRNAEHTATGSACKSPDHVDLEAGRDPGTRAALRAMSEAYRATLAEIRPMGGTLSLHRASSPRISKVVEATATVWPADWLAASNACAVPLHVGTSLKRAHYAHGTSAEIKGMGQPTTDYASRVWRAGRLRGQNAWEPEHDVKASTKHQGPGRVYNFYRGLSDEDLVQIGWNPSEHAGRAVRQTTWVVATDADFDTWSRATGRSVEDLRTGFERASDPDLDGGEPFWRKPHIARVTVSTERVGQIRLSSDKYAADPTRDARYRPAVHELGHRMEYVVPNLNRMARAWRERRVAESPTPEGRSLRAIYRGTGENGYSDSFTNHYMGRSYDDRDSTRTGVAENFTAATEIFSMGSEALFAGSEGGLIGLSRTKAADPDMRAFILGVFATAGMAGHDIRA